MEEEGPGVLVCHERPVVRLGLRATLEKVAGFRVVDESDDWLKALDGMQNLRPRAVLADIELPGLREWAAACRSPLAPESGLVLLVEGDESVIADCLRIGPRALLTRSCLVEDLVRAVRLVVDGKAFLSPELTTLVLDLCTAWLPEPPPHPAVARPLTRREGEVLQLMARGLSNKEIARTLILAEPTVKSHLSHVFRKLGARHRTQAVRLAYEGGLVGRNRGGL
jgi:DNA-binding NarL/FixJ family response regulator